MVPPLRNRSDVEALWNGTRKGELDVIASDHAPHSLEEKNKADFWSVKPGIPGLETTLPLLLTRIHRREIGLAQLVELLAENPARIFGLKGKGRLKEGLEGDVVLIDLKEKHRIDSSKFYSKAHFSPFDGVECVGKPVVTIASGHVVYDHGEIIETNVGKILARRVRP
jgi:dihydroorotase-like cyclic amidohydrolase